MHELQLVLFLDPLDHLLSLLLGVAGIDQVGFVALDCRPLHLWRVLRHDHIAGHAQQSADVGQRLAVIARAVGTHALKVRLALLELEQLVGGPSCLVGPHLLEVLALEVEGAPENRVNGLGV